LIVFPKSYQKYEQIWKIDSVVEIKGKINARDREGRPTDELKIIVDSAKELNADTARKWLKPQEQKETSAVAEAKAAPTEVIIRLNSISDASQLMSIKSVLDSAPGSDLVVFEFTLNSQKLKFPSGVNANTKLIDKLSSIAGKANVITKTKETAKK